MLTNSRRNLLKTSLSSIVVAGFGIPLRAQNASLLPLSNKDIGWVTPVSPDPYLTVENYRPALTPNFRALCKSETGVKSALEFARQNKFPFSIRSGGHCFEGLSQNAELTIDLRQISEVKVNVVAMTARVQPGEHLGM